nr:transposase [Rhodococcus sp. JVH1]
MQANILAAETHDPRRHRTRVLERPIESVNTKIRLIARRSFGSHTPDSVIALVMLSIGGARPQLPGRTHPRMSQ